jgi:predicted CopG family antitoxin
MHRKLTITIDDEVYRGLHERIGPRRISSFIEELVRPHVMSGNALQAAYATMAEDEDREREAREWVDADLGETLD